MITDTAEGVEGAEDLSLLKDKQSTDLNIFLVTPLTDAASGWVLLGVSLGCISLCLVLLVKLLLSILNGRVASWMRFAFNLEFRVPEIGNYVIVLSGCGITILMQVELRNNFNADTVGLVKVSPFTVGANVRTTVTGIRHDSCCVSLLLHIGRSAQLVPAAICSGRRTFDVESLGKHRSRHRRVPHTGCHCFLE